MYKDVRARKGIYMHRNTSSVGMHEDKRNAETMKKRTKMTERMERKKDAYNHVENKQVPTERYMEIDTDTQ